MPKSFPSITWLVEDGGARPWLVRISYPMYKIIPGFKWLFRFAFSGSCFIKTSLNFYNYDHHIIRVEKVTHATDLQFKRALEGTYLWSLFVSHLICHLFFTYHSNAKYPFMVIIQICVGTQTSTVKPNFLYKPKKVQKLVSG